MTLADLHLADADGILMAVVTGEIDMSNASDLASAITGGTSNDKLGVVFDLSDVTYLDSAGIHLLYRLRESLSSRRQALRLVIPMRSPVRDALRLAGVEDHMDMVETVPQAVEDLRPSDPVKA